LRDLLSGKGGQLQGQSASLMDGVGPAVFGDRLEAVGTWIRVSVSETRFKKFLLASPTFHAVNFGAGRYVCCGSWLRENVEVQRTHRRRFLRTAIEVMKICKWDQFPLI
jgi:hypothetical protein